MFVSIVSVQHSIQFQNVAVRVRSFSVVSKRSITDGSKKLPENLLPVPSKHRIIWVKEKKSKQAALERAVTSSYSSSSPQRIEFSTTATMLSWRGKGHFSNTSNTLRSRRFHFARETPPSLENNGNNYASFEVRKGKTGSRREGQSVVRLNLRVGQNPLVEESCQSSYRRRLGICMLRRTV